MLKLGPHGTAVSAAPTTLTTAIRSALLDANVDFVTRRGTGGLTAGCPTSSAASTAAGFMLGTPKWAGGVPGLGKTRRRHSDIWLED